MTYPDESLQGIIEPEDNWWEECIGAQFKRGRLVKAYLPYVNQNPLTLIPIERGDDPRQHKNITVRLEPLAIKNVMRYPDLPIAALPQRDQEIRTVYLAKKRPALILSSGGPKLERRFTKDKPSWQTDPTVLVAPYYGITEGYKRAGFSSEFVARVRACEYPQFLWDKLPIDKKEESIMRLDHMQPVGRHEDSIEFSNYCLSEVALSHLDEWLEWLLSGNLGVNTKLCEIRDFLLSMS